MTRFVFVFTTTAESNILHTINVKCQTKGGTPVTPWDEGKNRWKKEKKESIKICIQTGKKRNWEKLIGKSNSCKDFKIRSIRHQKKTKTKKPKKKKTWIHWNNCETIDEASWLTTIQFPWRSSISKLLFIMVIEFSGVQFGPKSQVWFQTKIARHEVQLPLYYIHFQITQIKDLVRSNILLMQYWAGLKLNSSIFGGEKVRLSWAKVAKFATWYSLSLIFLQFGRLL